MSITIHPYIRIGDLFEKSCGEFETLNTVRMAELAADDFFSHKTDQQIIVIVPSRGDKRIWDDMMRHLCGRRQEHGKSAAGKAMIWQDLYELICSDLSVKKRRLISPPDHHLLLRGILKGIFAAEPSREAASDSAGDFPSGNGLLKMYPGTARSGIIDILSDDISELLNEAVSPDELDVIRERSAPDDPSGTISHLLPTVYRRYLDYLAANGLLDSSQIWTAAKDMIKGSAWGQDRKIIFAGFMSFTHGQRELLNALDDNGSVVVLLKPESGLRDFADVSAQFPHAQLRPLSGRGCAGEKRSSHSGVSLLTMLSAESGIEAEAVARGLALHAMGKGPFASFDFAGFGNVGIMTDEDGADDLRNALRRFGIPHVLSSGRKISRTIVGRILSAVRSLDTADFPTRETIFFLSQPCFAGADFPAESALQSVDGGLAAWKAYLSRQSRVSDAEHGHRNAQTDAKKISLNALKATEELLKTIKSGGTPCELMAAFRKFLTSKGLWLERLNSMVSASYPPGAEDSLGAEYLDIDEYIRETASAIDTVIEKAESLSELTPDIGPLKDEILKGSDAFDFLMSWCDSSSTRPPIGLSGAVHVYTRTPPVLTSYDIWITLDVTQRRWPGSMTESPLLGERERTLLAENKVRLLSPADKTKQREALFRRMLFTGERLTILSRGLTDEKGRPSAESPLTEDFINSDLWDKDCSAAELPIVPISVLTDSKEVFKGIDAASEEHSPYITRHPDSKRRICAEGGIGAYIAEGRDVRLPPELHSSADDPSVNISDLKKLLCCPMRWLLERRLKIREHTLEPVSSAEWGNIVHTLWENSWRRFKEDTESSFMDIVNSELNDMQSGGGVYEKDYQRTLRDSRFQRTIGILCSQIASLASFQANVIDSTRQNGFIYKDILIENSISAELDGVRFSGRCDRIDILERNGQTFAVISDYKNGSAKSYESGIKELAKYRWHHENDDVSAISLGLQLSAYAKIFTESPLFNGITIAGVCFLGLRDGEARGTFDDPIYALYSNKNTTKRSNSPTIAKRIKEASYAMSCAASIVKEGIFYPVYGNDTCSYCSLGGICRKAEFMGEEEFSIETEAEDE